eukprot:6212432-Pleurochrysis_carterae.AAC.1
MLDVCFAIKPSSSIHSWHQGVEWYAPSSLARLENVLRTASHQEMPRMQLINSSFFDLHVSEHDKFCYRLSPSLPSWNYCQSFDRLMCAIQGRLPYQEGPVVRLNTAPAQLGAQVLRFSARQFVQLDVDALDRALTIYAHPAVYVHNTGRNMFDVIVDVRTVRALVMLPLMNQVCSNHEKLFSMSAGQDFDCKLDRAAYFRLTNRLQGVPSPPAPFVDVLNEVFRDGAPSNQLQDTGVLIHQFDGGDDW